MALPQGQKLAVDLMIARLNWAELRSDYLQVVDRSAPGRGRCEGFPYWRWQPSGYVWGESSAGGKFRQSHRPLRLMQLVTNSIRDRFQMGSIPTWSEDFRRLPGLYRSVVAF
jgi:hypothetical protein